MWKLIKGTTIQFNKYPTKLAQKLNMFEVGNINLTILNKQKDSDKWKNTLFAKKIINHMQFNSFISVEKIKQFILNMIIKY